MQAPFKSITSYTQFAVKTQPPTFQNPYGKCSHLISLPSDATTSKKNKPHAMHLLETQHKPALHIALSFKHVLLPAWRWMVEEATQSNFKGQTEASCPWQHSLKWTHLEQLGNYIIAIEYESTCKLQGYCLTDFLLDSVLWDLKTASDMVSSHWMIWYLPT